MNTKVGVGSPTSICCASTEDEVLRLPAPNVSAERYPAAVVWTPIPCITFFLPFVGHMGVCTSAGVCHDFAGPFYIGEDNLAFGNPTRYVPLVPLLFPSPAYTTVSFCDGSWEVRANTPSVQRPAERLAQFDRAIARVTDGFRRTQNYNFFCNNCHSFVASCLEEAEVGGKGASWNMVALATRVFFTGRFVSFGRFLWSVLPSCIVAAVIGIMAWKL